MIYIIILEAIAIGLLIHGYWNHIPKQQVKYLEQHLEAAREGHDYYRYRFFKLLKGEEW